MKINNLVEQIIKFPRPWILTGAGISTESGIPDFRSSGGIWEKVDPIENFSTWALYNNPQGFFTHGLPMFSQVLEAKPNDGHLIVGELQRKRFLGPVITQNVDSLHQKGGANWVYEIHGHIRTATCMNCPTTISIEELFNLVEAGNIPPKCECGGILKPDVILFGDSMPNDFQDAIRLIRSYNTTDNMIIVIGSSLTVSPINSFPFEFKKLAIINNSPTRLDNNAEIIITGTAGNTMQLIKARLIELNEGKELEILPAGFIPGRLANIIEDLGQHVHNTKKIFAKQDNTLGKLTSDILLLEKLFTNYPNYETRQPIEKYLINYSLNLIKSFKEKFKIKGKANLADGYMLKSIDNIISSHYEALRSYVRQDNKQLEVIEELALQTLGLIGLYKHISLIAGQTFIDNQVKEMPDKIKEIVNRFDININIEFAINDF